MVATPSTDLPTDPDTVRIIGVKAKPPGKSERRDERTTMRPASRVLRASFRTDYDAHVRRVAANYRIDPLLLHAVIKTESGYRHSAVSPAGAIGLMQIMPGTGATLGVDKNGLLDPALNIDAGARYLKRLQRRYGRNFDLILAAYNAGPGAVARYGNKIPPYRETRDYVGRVMGRYTNLRSGTGFAK